MTATRTFAAIGLAAVLSGGALWWLSRGGPSPQRLAPPPVDAPDIAPAAIYAATFTDPDGGRRSLGQFQGKILVVNFWATWCAPCREEIPAFSRLQARWAARGVQFVGISDEDRDPVSRYSREVAVAYPLWLGNGDGLELARRLGNRSGGLPFTVILRGDGTVGHRYVGAYSEARIDAELRRIAGN